MLDLNGKAAIVTGAASGIAKALTDAGMHLVLAADRAAIKARQARIEAAFDRAEAWEKTR